MTFKEWFEANIHNYGQADYDESGYEEVAEAAWKAALASRPEERERERLLEALLSEAVRLLTLDGAIFDPSNLIKQANAVLKSEPPMNSGPLTKEKS